MKDKVKYILVDIALIFVVFILLLIFHTVFIAGPRRVMEHEDNLYVEAFSKQEKIQNIEFQNRFSLSKTYYIAKDKNNLYYFDQDLKETGKTPYVSLEKVVEKAQELGFEKKHVSYGVFDKEIVFNLERKGHVIFLDINDLNILFEFGG